MSESTEYGQPEGLHLINRDQVETAWQAAAITGLAPAVEQTLESLLEIHVPQEYRTNDGHISLYLGGESGVRAKNEVVSSLHAAIENLEADSVTSKLARALLDILQAE